MSSKICTSCKHELSIENFTSKEKEKEYKRCLSCRLKWREYGKDFMAKHPDTIKNSARKYREKNLEQIREKDKILKREYRKNNQEHYQNTRSAYNEKNREKLLAYDRNRMNSRPEYFLFSSARQRARKANLEFSITEQDVKELLEATVTCPLRLVKFEKGSNHKPRENSASIDRIDSNLGYTKENIQIISYLANSIKNQSNLEIFETIVKGLKDYKIIEHNINDTFSSIINRDRESLIREKKPSRGNKYAIKNLEKGLLARAKRRAQKKNLEFNIDENYLKSIWPIDNCCPILGVKFVSGNKSTDKHSATIDRIDNNLGYVKGNIQVISALVNSVKNKATIEELEFILNNWKKIQNI